MSRVTPARWLVPAALASALPFLGKAPVIDEESYLWLGAHVSMLRPYDWHRIWQPYTDAPDSFIFAHPPLFLWGLAALHAVSPTVWLARLWVLLPFGALYAWAVARWASRATAHADLAAGIWLASACVQLGLQDSLMIDLPAVALVTAGLALYREALEEGEGLARAGAVLGLALATKYAMAMVVVPVLVHMGVAVARRRLAPAHAAALVAPMLLIPAAGEAAMLAAYGRVHAYEVLLHRNDIASGPMLARGLGVLTRMALLPLPLVLLLARPVVLALGAMFGLVVLGVVHPSGPSGVEVGVLLVCAMVGGAAAARAVTGVFSGARRRRKGDRDDALLLGLVVLGTMAGVAFGHNYASARYLLPAAAPLAMLYTRSAEEVSGGKTLARIGLLVSVIGSLALATADYRFARAGVETAVAAADKVEKRAPPDRRFAGEWSFRYALEQRGWSRYTPGEALAPGTLVVVAEHASPGDYPRGVWEPVDRVESVDRFPVRVMLPGHGIGLYAETLGPLPFGLSGAPMESATVYRVGGAAAPP